MYINEKLVVAYVKNLFRIKKKINMGFLFGVAVLNGFITAAIGSSLANIVNSPDTGFIVYFLCSTLLTGTAGYALMITLPFFILTAPTLCDTRPYTVECALLGNIIDLVNTDYH